MGLFYTVKGGLLYTYQPRFFSLFPSDAASASHGGPLALFLFSYIAFVPPYGHTFGLLGDIHYYSMLAHPNNSGKHRKKDDTIHNKLLLK